MISERKFAKDDNFDKYYEVLPEHIKRKHGGDYRMRRVQYADLLPDGHLFIPSDVIKRLEIKEGVRLPLLETAEGILIKKSRMKKGLEWEERVDKLLNKIWSRVERYPITNKEIDYEVEEVRANRYAESRS